MAKCQTSNLICTKSRNLKCFSSRPAVAFAQSIEARCLVENEDVVGAAPTGSAPTTSEWSTILLPTKVHIILVVLWYLFAYTMYFDVIVSIQVSGYRMNVMAGIRSVYFTNYNIVKKRLTEFNSPSIFSTWCMAGMA